MTNAATDDLRKTRHRPRRIRRMGVAALFSLFGVYVLYCGAMFFAQNSLIFPGWLIVHQNLASSAPEGVESVWITGTDGSRVEAWYCAAQGASAEHPAPAAIYFHGNGEVIDGRMGVAEAYAAEGVSTLLVEYRGYGRSGGRPSQTAIAEDAIAFHNWLCARPDVDCDRLVYHGRSLGGGIAVELARTHEPRALILESTFTSIAEMATKRGLPSLLVRSPFRNDLTLPKLTCAILILHGTQDQAIAVEHGRRLHQLAPRSRYLELDGGHNDFPRDFAAYLRETQAFLRESGVTGP